MEKLQAALEKAREQRGETGLRPSKSRRAKDQGLADSELNALWDEIPFMEINKTRLQKRKLIFCEAGRLATPFDMLRTKVLQIVAANGWKRLAVTSPSPGCGKTTTAANLAISLGRQQDLRVMLFDMDMRRPALLRSLMQKPKVHNTYDVLERRIPLEQQAERIGKNLIISGNSNAMRDPADLFLRQRTGDIIDEIEATYKPDLMVFDMPPMLINDDTSAFLKHVDCALIVVEAGQSTVEQVDLCEKELAVQTNVLGMVLNKCRFQSDGYGYYSNYGSKY